MFLNFLAWSAPHVIGLCDATGFERGVGGDSEFGPFAEAFEKLYADCVGEAPVSGIVVGAVGVEVLVFPEFVGLDGVVVGESVVAVNVIEGVNEFGDGDINVARQGVVYLFFGPVSEFKCMGHEGTLTAHTGLCGG